MQCARIQADQAVALPNLCKASEGSAVAKRACSPASSISRMQTRGSSSLNCFLARAHGAGGMTQAAAALDLIAGAVSVLVSIRLSTTINKIKYVVVSTLTPEVIDLFTPPHSNS